MKEPLSRREFLKRGVIAGTALSASSIGAWSIGSSIARADAVRPALDPDALRKFGASLKGGLILPKDPSYEAARHIRNARYDKRPSVIVRCAATEDVVRAVEFAHKSNLAVAVRSGGHDLAGYSTCDDGMVIDLGGMRSAIVDSDKQSIRVQTGLSVGEFYKALEAHGLGTNAGECASVGMGGLTLGGGEGMLMGKYGMACDNVVSAEIVTAAGHVLKANAHKNADLFWAIRGGGGNFGVVTSVEFRAYPVSRLLAGSVIHPLSKARDVLRFYRDLIATAPDELTSGFTMTALPSAEPSIAIDVCYCGNADDGEKVLKRLRSFGSPVKDTIKARSLSEAMLMEEPPAGLISHARGGFVQNLSDASISALLLHLDETPPTWQIAASHLHGATCRGDSAFPIRRPGLDTIILASWGNASDKTLPPAWVNRTWQALEPFTSGVYVNMLEDEGERRARAAYGANYDRLATIKKKYDLGNFFHMNQNIAPAG